MSVKLVANYDSLIPGRFDKASVEECLDWAWEQDSLAVDTETLGMDCHSKPIVALQLGNAFDQYVIDVRGIDILLFKELLESKLVLLHNAKFDYKFLKKAGILLTKIYDTMLAECVIYAGYKEFGYGLDKLCERYLGVVLDKEDRGGFYKLRGEPFNEFQIDYAAKDVAHLHQIRDKQLELLIKYNLLYCAELEFKALKGLADIEYNGILLDSVSWSRNTEEYKVQVKAITEELDSIVLSENKLSKYRPKYVQADLFGEARRELNINYGSPTQLLKLITDLGITIEDTNDRSLEKVKRLHPFIPKLQEFREKNKVLTTYGDNFLDYINPVTGRVHTSFWQLVSTGRVSSGSRFDNSPNMQNIPAADSFRSCFIAREGYSIVSGDYVGQELCLMADRSNEEAFIEALNEDKDLHCISATMIYGRPITKADKVERTAAKIIVFGLCYGMGEHKLADSLSITVDEAKELLSKYDKAFPRLMRWLKDSGNQAKKNKRAVTEDICNRVRWFPEMKNVQELRDSGEWKRVMIIEGETERQGKNHLIQGSAANVTKEALVEVRELVNQYNSQYGEVAYLIGTVHDEINCEVRDDLAQEFSIKMKEVMVNCGNKYVSKVKMKVDVTVDKYWKK